MFSCILYLPCVFLCRIRHNIVLYALFVLLFINLFLKKVYLSEIILCTSLVHTQLIISLYSERNSFRFGIVCNLFRRFFIISEISVSTMLLVTRFNCFYLIHVLCMFSFIYIRILAICLYQEELKTNILNVVAIAHFVSALYSHLYSRSYIENNV